MDWGGGTYTHLRPRSLQFEQDGCLPAFETGRSLRSHLTLNTKGDVCVSEEYIEMGRGREETKRTIGGNESGMVIRSGGSGRSPPHSASPTSGELLAGRLRIGIFLGATGGGRGGAL
jgi:hypothetical protein